MVPVEEKKETQPSETNDRDYLEKKKKKKKEEKSEEDLGKRGAAGKDSCTLGKDRERHTREREGRCVPLYQRAPHAAACFH